MGFLDILPIFIGAIVGILMGSTGMGGGLIMTPVLLFVFGLSPAVAVGTDMIFATITKIFGVLKHWRQKSVNFELVQWVLLGSVPGSLVGVLILFLVKDQDQLFNIMITKTMGIVFLLIAGILIMQLTRNVLQMIAKPRVIKPSWMIIMGWLVGFLVSVTSVGSGTLFIAFFALFSRFKASQLVGADLLHGVIVTGIAGISHYFLGTVDVLMIIKLLMGSIPGVFIGSKLTVMLPEKYIRFAILLLLTVSALKLL